MTLRILCLRSSHEDMEGLQAWRDGFLEMASRDGIKRWHQEMASRKFINNDRRMAEWWWICDLWSMLIISLILSVPNGGKFWATWQHLNLFSFRGLHANTTQERSN